MRIELLAIVSMVGLGACAAEPVNSDTGDVEREDAVMTPDPSCAGAEEFSELAQRSCKLGEPVDEHGFTLAERGASATSGEVSTRAVRTYTGGCTGWGGCSRVYAEGWEFMACGAFLYAYENFSGANGNLISAGTGFCLF